MTTPWPYPGDSREDKAKLIALSYRQLVFDITQGNCTDPAGELHRLDQKWAERGVRWHLPRRPEHEILDPDQWMSAPDLAQAIDRTRKDIYNWARLGHIQQRARHDGTPEYSVESVITYNTKLRQRRVSHDNVSAN